MKSLILILSIFTSFSLLAQDDSVFIQQDWVKAQALAKETGKPLVVDFYTEWCGWCKVMDRETFSDDDVKVKLTEEYVALKIDAEKGIGLEVARKYRVTAFPTIGFFSSEGHLMGKALGYITLDKFPHLLDSMAQYNVAGLNRFPGISTSLDLDMPAFTTMSRKTEKDKTKFNVLAKKWFENNADFSSEINFSVLSKYSWRLSENDIQNFMNQKNELKELYGKAEVNGVSENILYSRYGDIRKSESKKEFDALINDMNLYYDSPKEQEQSAAYFKRDFAFSTKDFSKFVELTQKEISNGSISNSSVNEYAWSLYEKCEDKKCLEAALDWMKFVDDENADYNHIDTYAALAFKLDKFELAKEYAEKAIALGTAKEADVSGTQKLLVKIEVALANF
jgi:thioredoxin-related protein